jgi:hypothetical protein
MGELLLHVELVPQRVLQLFTLSLSTPNQPENGVLRQSRYGPSQKFCNMVLTHGLIVV